jgi:transposase
MAIIAMIGIDLAKNVFQFHTTDRKGHKISGGTWNRSKMMKEIQATPPCTIAIEACGGSHFFAREFGAMGHKVQMIAAQHVTPFRRGNKNDKADAAAICVAARQPEMRFVSPKSIKNQALHGLTSVRRARIGDQTARVNQLRALLMEFGIVFPKGVSTLIKAASDLISTPGGVEGIPPEILEEVQIALSALVALGSDIKRLQCKINSIGSQDPGYQDLLSIPGVGETTAACLLWGIGSPAYFDDGRNFSAYLGLVPKCSGTGGRNVLGGITKRGNTYLRSLLVHGARAWLMRVKPKAERGEQLGAGEAWVYRIYLRKGWNKACVALANKNARIAWKLLSEGQKYDSNKAFAKLAA